MNNDPVSQNAGKLIQAKASAKQKVLKDKFQACLLGGAIGDAVGRPIERVRIKDIYRRYGENGIQDMATVGLRGRITDDTQMTIFTTDGLIKSALSGKTNSEEPDYGIVYDSYKDWYSTQVEGLKDQPEKIDKGWVGELDELYYPGGAGPTCLGSLKNGVMGTLDAPVNNSKSCGAVMRMAPIGLMYSNNPEMAFDIGMKCGVMTHGNPTAYLPAGVFACIVAHATRGEDIPTAIQKSLDTLKTKENSEELHALLSKAVELSKNDDLKPIEAIEELGKGWLGDEAMAISIYCALKAPDNFKEAVLMAVNHDGDSDSTGAIVGNILGAAHGSRIIPEDWGETVELSDEIKTLATDLNNPTEANVENYKKKS